jgi:hypothetical protein
VPSSGRWAAVDPHFIALTQVDERAFLLGREGPDDRHAGLFIPLIEEL